MQNDGTPMDPPDAGESVMVPREVESLERVLRIVEASRRPDDEPEYISMGGLRLLAKAARLAAAPTQNDVRDAERERDAWMETARLHCNGEAYYRGLLDEIAATIGPEAYRADNGDEMGSVVRARLPHLVRAALDGGGA